MNEYLDVNIQWDWLPAPDVRAPELRSTWARLELDVGGQHLTLVEDVESASSRRSVYLPLYPLAEWIAFNWWSLIANSRPAMLLSRLPRHSDLFFEPIAKTYRERHGLRGAGDGFLWPNLLILPEGQTTRLLWRADNDYSSGHPIRYITSGDKVVDGYALRQRLASFVDAVLIRLQEQGARGTALENEWQAIQGMTDEESSFCTAAARLGLDPYSEAAPYEEAILSASEALSQDDLLDDFLAAVEPSEIVPSIEWISKIQDELDSLSTTGFALSKLRSALAPSANLRSGLPPWELGWQQARIVRSAMSLNVRDRLSIEGVLTSVVRTAPTKGVQALGGVALTANPPIVLAHRQKVTTKRFTLARALWHLLWRDSPRFLITSAHTDTQKAERAFAAELLAPAAGIAEMIEGDVLVGLDEDALDGVSATYGVSPIVVQHQVDNQLVGALRPW